MPAPCKQGPSRLSKARAVRLKRLAYFARSAAPWSLAQGTPDNPSVDELIRLLTCYAEATQPRSPARKGVGARGGDALHPTAPRSSRLASNEEEGRERVQQHERGPSSPQRPQCPRPQLSLPLEPSTESISERGGGGPAQQAPHAAPAPKGSTRARWGEGVRQGPRQKPPQLRALRAPASCIARGAQVQQKEVWGYLPHTLRPFLP